jgi:hypothetical protein
MKALLGVLVLQLAAISVAGAHVVMYLPLDLQTQVNRADHVVRAKILEVVRREPRDPNMPMGKCGVFYKMRIVEQFKGELRGVEWFTTYRILFPERPLSAGEHVLVLLRDMNKDHPFDRFEFKDGVVADENRLAYDRIRACGEPQTPLYLTMGEEAIFQIIPAGHGTQRREWMEYSRIPSTNIPDGIGPTKPEQCEKDPESGACTVFQSARVDWLAIRRVLSGWTQPH